MLPKNTPQFEDGTVTLPSVEGVTWIVDGKSRRAGKLAALKPGESVRVEVEVESGIRVDGDREWVFSVPKEDSEE